MPRPALSLSKSMAVVALLATDFAVLRDGGRIIPNPGLVVMVVVLEVGLFFLFSRKGPTRAFWVGFEIAGWAYILAHAYYRLPIWMWSRRMYEDHILGASLMNAGVTLRFILTAGAFQLALCLLIALASGFIARFVARRRLSSTPGPSAPGGA